jgi:hypothetical protein
VELCDVLTQPTILKHLQKLWGFWRDIQHKYNLGELTDDFFTPNWIGRGREYRLLVEPLDIANFYYKEKNCDGTEDGKHYVDGINDKEELTDNMTRPGRYILLQQQEARYPDRFPFRSSLGKGRQMKELLGGKSSKEKFPKAVPLVRSIWLLVHLSLMASGLNSLHEPLYC